MKVPFGQGLGGWLELSIPKISYAYFFTRSVSVDPREELGQLLLTASKTQDSLVDFVRDVGVILERLRALRRTHDSLTPEAAEMMKDNADVLAINVDRPPHPVERPRGVFDDVFGELFDGA